MEIWGVLDQKTTFSKGRVNRGIVAAGSEMMRRSNSSDRAEILNFLAELDSAAYAYGHAQLYVDRATACLFQLEESPAKETLQAMADFVISRNA